MQTIKDNHFWNWVRKLYLLFWFVFCIYFANRVIQTIHYWSLMQVWGVQPGRLYTLLTGMFFSGLGIAVCGLLLWRKGQAMRWVSGLSLLFFIWLWVDQLWLSQIPDRFENIPFLAVESILFAGWTFFVFQKEMVHGIIR
jgi:hypothetical protein